MEVDVNSIEALLEELAEIFGSTEGILFSITEILGLGAAGIAGIVSLITGIGGIIVALLAALFSIAVFLFQMEYHR